MVSATFLQSLLQRSCSHGLAHLLLREVGTGLHSPASDQRAAFPLMQDEPRGKLGSRKSRAMPSARHVCQDAGSTGDSEHALGTSAISLRCNLKPPDSAVIYTTCPHAGSVAPPTLSPHGHKTDYKKRKRMQV